MRLAKKIGTNNFKLGVYLQLEAEATKAIKNHEDDYVRCAFKILTLWHGIMSSLDWTPVKNDGKF